MEGLFLEVAGASKYPGLRCFAEKSQGLSIKWLGSLSPARTSCVMDGWEAVHELGLVWGCDVLIGQLVGPTEPLITDLTQQPFGVLQASVPVFSPCCADRAGRSCRAGDDSLKLMVPRVVDGASNPKGSRYNYGGCPSSEDGIRKKEVFGGFMPEQDWDRKSRRVRDRTGTAEMLIFFLRHRWL